MIARNLGLQGREPFGRSGRVLEGFGGLGELDFGEGEGVDFYVGGGLALDDEEGGEHFEGAVIVSDVGVVEASGGGDAVFGVGEFFLEGE